MMNMLITVLGTNNCSQIVTNKPHNAADSLLISSCALLAVFPETNEPCECHVACNREDNGINGLWGDLVGANVKCDSSKLEKQLAICNICNVNK